MSIKLYITAIDSRENGTAVTLFEDHLVTYTEKEYVGEDTELGQEIFNKIEAVEKINNQTSSPF